jgi:hypothetical protein
VVFRMQKYKAVGEEGFVGIKSVRIGRK